MSKRTNERMIKCTNEWTKEWKNEYLNHRVQYIQFICIHINEIVFVLRFDQLRNSLCVCRQLCFSFPLEFNWIFFFKNERNKKTSTARIPTNSNNNNNNSRSNSKQKRSIELANYYSKYTAFKSTHCNEQNCTHTHYVCVSVFKWRKSFWKNKIVFLPLLLLLLLPSLLLLLLLLPLNFARDIFFALAFFSIAGVFHSRFLCFCFFRYFFFARRYNDGCRAMFLCVWERGERMIKNRIEWKWQMVC